MNCTFDGSGSVDSDGTIASYAWAFGDGTTASGAVESHAYAVPGTYTTTLTVTDNGGATGTFSQAVVLAASHVGDLDGASTSQGGSWTAVVTITVHESSHAIVANAGVSGSWTGGSTASCTTNGAGQCTVSRSSIPNATKTATFTVAGVTHPSLIYRPADNHDPDGDSSGSGITVSRR
jgi:PKD repeat protein